MSDPSGRPAENGAQAIDRTSPIPYYHQLQAILREQIEAGRWQPGDLIPSEAEIQREYGVSRTVIRGALDILESDGHVVRVKGKGTLVARPKLIYEGVRVIEEFGRANATALPRLSRALESRRVAVGGYVARILDLEPPQDVFEYVVTHDVMGEVMALTQGFLRLDASEGTAVLASSGQVPTFEAGDQDDLAQFAKRYGVKIVRASYLLEASPASEFEAQTLGVKPGVPVFMVSATEFDGEGRPVIFTRSTIRSDQFRFSVEVRRDTVDDAAR